MAMSGAERQRRYRATPKGRAAGRSRLARRIRMRAGGIQFTLGYAPTPEAAEQIRQTIREAPRAVQP